MLGRVAAKKAIAVLRPDLPSRDVAIDGGVFQQPVVWSRDALPVNVSITHTGFLASAVAFPAGHPLGIDMERIDSADIETIKTQVSIGEVPAASPGSTEAERFTRVWTIKEALSKILGCGMMTPFSLFTPIDAEFWRDGSYRGGFKFFPQYRFVSVTTSQVALALVHPARTLPVCEWNQLAMRLDSVWFEARSGAEIADQ